MATKATLGGLPLTADTTVGWELKQGVEPYQRTFTMSNDLVQELMKRSSGLRPVTLLIQADGAPDLEVDFLYVVATAPARAPYLTNVVVADVRFQWTREWHTATYNERRGVGDFYAINDTPGGVVDLGVLPPAKNIFYAKYSMKDDRTPNPKPWKAKDMVEDVLKVVAKPYGAGYSMAGYDSATAGDLPIEGLTFDDPGPSAVARAMGYVPGLAVYVDYKGVTQLTSRVNQAEIDILDNSDAPIVGPDLVTMVDLADVRPASVEVYFSSEPEIRFDYVEGASHVGTGQNDPRVMDNVLPLPDPILTIKDDSGTPRTVYQGTWVQINQNLFDAWNSDPLTSYAFASGSMSATLPSFSWAMVQTMLFNPVGYSAYEHLMSLDGVDPIISRRLQALAANYRQTYQVSRHWWDRLKGILPVRASVMDPSNGIRCPAQVYQNYTRVPLLKRIGKKTTDNSDVATPVKAFPVTAYAYGFLPFLGNCRPVPSAVVVIEDPDQGVMRIHIKNDALGQYTQMIPSLMQSIWGTGIPSDDPANQADTTIGYGVGSLVLSTNHAASVVLTAIPASPNNRSQLTKITVGPNDVKALLPANVIGTTFGESRGPVWKLRVGPQILTARYAWSDDQKQNIEDAFFDDSTSFPFSLCVNPGQITAFAKAAAAALYSTLLDRPEGVNVTGLAPSVLPVGRIDAVAHELRPSGAALTALRLPHDVKPLDIFSLIPESYRRKILGLAGVRRYGGGAG